MGIYYACDECHVTLGAGEEFCPDHPKARISTIVAGDDPEPEPDCPTGDVAERLLLAAERHGADSDPDHEAGDLRDIIREMWDLLPGPARATLYQARKDYLDDWAPE